MRTAVFLAPLLAASVALPVRADGMTDRLGEAVKDGTLRMEIALGDGRVGVAKGFALETAGHPLLALETEARDGRVRAFCASVSRGALVLRGAGLRPSIRIDELSVGEAGTIASARYRGTGVWSRLLLSVFGGMARKELAKIRFRTGIPDLIRGELLAPDTAAAAPAAPPPLAGGQPPAKAPAPSRSEDFLRLVDHVRIGESEITAFGGRPLDFGEKFRMTTGRGEPLRVSIREAIYLPDAASGLPAWRMEGGLDGTLGEGSILWDRDRLAFSGGSLEAGRFLFEEGIGERSELSAGRLALDLTSGRFPVAPGVEVMLAAPSRFAARELVLSGGDVRALIDLDLTGRTGEIRRQGSRLTLADAHVTATALRLARGRADGDVRLDFDYRLVYPFVVKYPVPELEPRTVPLEFRGPFAASLHLASVGAGGEDAITGSYRFSVNWPPIEKAAFEAVRARWVQDVTGLKKVSFDIQPERFAPCGEECFLASFRVTAAKVGSKRFSLRCAPQGQARLVLDKDARAFVLKGLEVAPRCEGLLGKLANLIAPLFAKTYEDLVLFQVPEGLPFTIEKVQGTPEALEIAGAVVWREAAAAVP